MVTEVNKIIYNLIVSGREVCIGGVGTLFTVRYAAYRASRKSLVPPYRIVEFTTEQRGVLLEEEIARVAGVDAQKAHELFERWHSAVVDGETLTIEGVGKLRKDRFVADEAFLAALNPQGRAPMRLKPKANVGLYVFASLCICFAVAVAGYLYLDNSDISLLGKGAESAAEELVSQNVEAEPAESLESPLTEVVDSVKVELPIVETQPESEPVAQPQLSDGGDEEIRSTVLGRSYVVLGVFSTPENAANAALQARKRADDMHYSIYYYGSKYMVALYDAPSRDECQEFVRSLNDTFTDLWIYTRK